jgi:hypothetical protein
VINTSSWLYNRPLTFGVSLLAPHTLGASVREVLVYETTVKTLLQFLKAVSEEWLMVLDVRASTAAISVALPPHLSSFSHLKQFSRGGSRYLNSSPQPTHKTPAGGAMAWNTKGECDATKWY